MYQISNWLALNCARFSPTEQTSTRKDFSQHFASDSYPTYLGHLVIIIRVKHYVHVTVKMCEAFGCKEQRVTFTCGGYFCHQHKGELVFLQKHVARAKADFNVFMEYQLRREIAKIRRFDRGHYERFMRLEQELLRFGKRRAPAPTQLMLSCRG